MVYDGGGVLIGVVFEHMDPVIPGSTCLNAYLTDTYFKAFIRDQMVRDAGNHMDHVPCPGLNIEFSLPMCLMVASVPITGGGTGGGATHTLQYWSCPAGTSYCRTIYSACWDYTTLPATYTYSIVSQTIYYGLGCTETQPSLPPYGKTYEDSWETPCFSVGCD